MMMMLRPPLDIESGLSLGATPGFIILAEPIGDRAEINSFNG